VKSFGDFFGNLDTKTAAINAYLSIHMKIFVIGSLVVVDGQEQELAQVY